MSDGDSFNLCDSFLSPARLADLADATAIEYRGQSISYAELSRLVNAWATRFVERGISAGDRVALLLYDSPLFIAAFLAGARVGAINVPINTALPADDIQFIIADSAARLVVCEEELEQKLASTQTPASRAVNLLTVDARRWTKDETP